MRMPAPGANVAVFALFFGVSLLEAFASGNWMEAVLWLALGVVFLRADALKSSNSRNSPHGSCR